MTDAHDFEHSFWDSIRSDMTAMVGISGIDPRPMTAQFDGDRKTLYFFTAKDTELAMAMATANRKTAMLTYTAKGHDLFATIHGSLQIDNDPAMVDRLWNRFVSAWFEGGKDDPRLCLLRFDPEKAEIWKDAASIVAGVKLFLGIGDPKEDYEDSVAEIKLNEKP
jgi:general stress protein 26